MLCPIVMFAVSYPLPQNSGQLVDIGVLSAYHPLALAAYVAGIAAMFALYVMAVHAASTATGDDALRPVIVGGVLFAVIMAAMYPVNAIDLFIYAVRSRIFTAHGENPHLLTPADFPADPMMAFSSAEWSVTVSPYGPLWNLIAAPITAIAGDNLLAALIGFKVLAVLAVLAGAWLIARALRAGGLPVAAGVALYLWNPLVLWEGIGNGHNDPVMMVPILAAAVAWRRGRDHWVIPLLVLAALIKYVAVLTIPLALVALWRRQPAGGGRTRWLFASAGLSAAAVLASLVPFFDLGAIWRGLTEQGSIFLTSPAAVTLSLLRDRIGGAEATALVTLVSATLMATFLLIQLLILWQRPAAFPRALYETLFFFLLVAAWNFRVWYLIWLVALAAVLPLGWPAWRAIAWTAGGLAGYALFIWVWHWWEVEFPTIQVVGVLVLTGPAVIVTLGELGRTLRHRSQVAGPAPIETRRPH